MANGGLQDSRFDPIVDACLAPPSTSLLDLYLGALEAWAAANKDLFVKPRSIELNWGTVGFSRTPWKIVILGRLKVETVIEKLRAAKLKTLIRVKEEIDREKAIAYLNSDLAKVGLKKVQRDEFYFEVKEIEVK